MKKIFIIWASGNVWRELVKQILENDSEKSVIVWVANSRSYIFDINWIDKNILEFISNSRQSAIEIFSEKSNKFGKLTDLVDLIKDNWLDGKIIFADVTAWKQELLEMHDYILNNSNNFLSTANKNPISLYSMKEFNRLINLSDRYDTNTTVMWWGWVLNFVDERYNKINDKIRNISWVFSWTLWYIMSELEKNELSFSKIVKQAKEQGYTEPNPWDDLNWLDVARKVVILARYSGMNVDINDVIVNPLIDEKYSKFEWNDFLEAIKAEDDFFHNKVIEVSKQNKCLRYIWKIIWWKMTVWLKVVEKNSDLWWLSGTANLAIVETDILENPVPHVIKSRWAWLAVTAASVRVWISKFKI
jgi:bifunctional aspartokinase / homoserine dehydrogenase 1